MVMARRAKKAVLADGGMRTDGNLGHAIAVHTLAQASVVAHLQVPGAHTGDGIRMYACPASRRRA